MKLEVKEVVVAPPPKEYVVTLNQNELDLLVALMGKQAGYDGEKGWRVLMDKMWEDLSQHATKRPFSIFNNSGNFPYKDRIVPKV